MNCSLSDSVGRGFAVVSMRGGAGLRHALLPALGLGLCLATVVAGAGESAPGAAPDWELELNRCLFTRTRCPGTLTVIYEHLQNAKADPGPDDWRLKYWQRRLRDYYRFNADRPE